MKTALKQQLLITLGVLALVAGLVAQAEATLQVRYTFDEASSGTTTALNSGAAVGANGVFSDNATRTSSTPANYSLGALNVNPNTGNNDYVGPAGDVDAVDGLSAMTLTTWVNVQTFTSGNGFTALADDFTSGAGWWWYASAKVGGGVATNSLMQLGLTINSHNYDAYTTDGGTTPVYINTSNAWVFVAAVWNGSNVRFYSGTTNSPATQVGADQTFSTSMTDNTALLRVGANPAGFADRSHPGFMDDFRIYNTALSLSQLESIRLEDLPVQPAPEPSMILLFGVGGVMLWARRRNRVKSVIVAGLIGSLCLGAQFASATLLSITNPNYTGGTSPGSAPADTNGWSSINTSYAGTFGVDTQFNVAGAPAGSMYFGCANNLGSSSPVWIYQRLTSTASATENYTLSVYFYNYLNTYLNGWHYKLDLFTADVGEDPTSATLLGSLDVDPATIPVSTAVQSSLSVLGASIPVGELGKNLMIAAAVQTTGGTVVERWGYVDAWTLDAASTAIPEPTTALLLVLGGLTTWRWSRR